MKPKEDLLLFIEKERHVPMFGKYDVLVVGGGPAGCSAAIAAARYGKSVLLLEKTASLGGAAVQSLAAAVLSTNAVDFEGIWHEVYGAVNKMGGFEGFKKHADFHFQGSVHPEYLKKAWEDLVLDAGVKLLYHAYFSEPVLENEKIKGLIIETRGGRMIILGHRVIDCTGDGIVAAKAGAPWEIDEGMACSKIFRLQGITSDLTDWVEKHEIQLKHAWKRRHSGYIPVFPKILKEAVPASTGFGMATNRLLGVDPLDVEQITKAEIEGREIAWKIANFVKKEVKGAEKLGLLDIAPEVGVRVSRRIVGLARLTFEDVLYLRKYKDGIANASWNIDHVSPARYEKAPVQADLVGAYKERFKRVWKGDYYQIPYGSLVPLTIEGLLVAGRCISSDPLAQASARIQQTCISTGQAAGTAAALSIDENVTPGKLDTDLITNRLSLDRSSVVRAFDFEKRDY